MQYKDYGVPDTPLVPVAFSFLKPATFKIRKKNGEIQNITYGIGEIITVMKPRVVFLLARHELLEEILMSDGRVIIEYPDDLNVKRISYNGE